MEIVYRFRIEDGTEFVWDVDVEARRQHDDRPHAEWTRLSYQQCPNCPLDPERNEYCPAALEIEDVAERFVNAVSYDRVDVTVETENRQYFKNCDFQEAIRSLFGLLMSTSDCPILSRLRPLAISHLPFSTLHETVQRMAGAYLIKQRGRQRRGEAAPDWDMAGIDALYQELDIVNAALMKRLKGPSIEDANLNAISMFSSVSTLVVVAVDDILEAVESEMEDGF